MIGNLNYTTISLYILLCISATSFKLSLNHQSNGYDRTISQKYVSYAAVALCPKNCV